jgi:hypothetical protein
VTSRENNRATRPKDEIKWEVLSSEELTQRFDAANKLKEEGNKFYNDSKFHEVRKVGNSSTDIYIICITRSFFTYLTVFVCWVGNRKIQSSDISDRAY